MEQANNKAKSKEKTYIKLMREAMIKKVGEFLDFLVSISVLNAYKVKRDFGMGDSTFNNMRLCKLTISSATLDKMVYVMAFYLSEYQKAVQAEPNGHDRKEKLTCLPTLFNTFKTLYGHRAEVALEMVDEGIDLRQIVKKK